ncbi:MAG: SPOR domain-containing protein, partial [Spirochaetaceae bacterium]|nr:SPOR domain-containing protein [Spirochaetaceae bacterium]
PETSVPESSGNKSTNPVRIATEPQDTFKPESDLIDPSLLIPSLDKPRIATEPRDTFKPETSIPESSGNKSTNPVRIATEPQNTPATDKALPFSAPVVNTLEKNKYYVQLAAFGKPDVLKSELSKIEAFYPVMIEDTGTVYRLLLGPVNQGESKALLQHFKSAGYSGAFVRQGS